MALVLLSCVPSFCPSYRFVFGALLANMALFRVLKAFLARFGRFVWVYVVLVLCVDCVALYACGVRRIKGLMRVCPSFCLFALVFILFALVLSLCISSGLCLCCPRLVRFCCFVFVSSFSLSDYTQKERARRVGASSLRVL